MTPLKTRTGLFPIGFRRGWSDWHKDLPGVLAWAKENALGVIDVGADVEAVKVARAAGFIVGSADLVGRKELISPDKSQRDEAVAQAARFIREASAAGAANFFCVMVPAKPELSRRENFAYMAESFSRLAPVLEECRARVVIEGWPGPGALCCTPEGYRAFFREVPSGSMGINYDPSHLVRMGIDPIRFLEEFAGRVYHVHGKDTEILPENLYEFGSEQPATFAKPLAFGAMHWRYTIPGHGVVRWVKVFEILKSAGYAGAVSIELEDAHFNGQTQTEQQGILAGARFLAGC